MSAPYQPPADHGIAVIYADDQVVVVNKPAGLLSVPGRGDDKQDCLSQRVRQRFPDALVVHRLDMSTSGILLMARGEASQSEISRQFRERLIDKRYIAVVGGLLTQAAGEIDFPLICDWPNRPRQKVDYDIGKRSLTHYRLMALNPDDDTSRVELTPITGRSHQLRVHMAALGYPILGDDLYAGVLVDRADRLLLHATYLAFTHPASGQRMAFDSLPDF